MFCSLPKIYNDVSLLLPTLKLTNKLKLTVDERLCTIFIFIAVRCLSSTQFFFSNTITTPKITAPHKA